MEPIVSPAAGTVPCTVRSNAGPATPSTGARTFRSVAAALLASLVALAAAGAGAADVGDDGLHEQDWFVDSFRDVAEDAELAAAEGRQVLVLYEQRGCPYCAKLHATLLDDPAVRDALRERFDVVQYDLVGATEVIDLDGAALTEASAAERWGIRFTPTMLFLPDASALETLRADGAVTAREAALAVLPGVPAREEFLALIERVKPHGDGTAAGASGADAR